MALATYPSTTTPTRTSRDNVPDGLPQDTPIHGLPARRVRCYQTGHVQQMGTCPCYQALAPDRARELANDLDVWMTDFDRRHPEYAP